MKLVALILLALSTGALAQAKNTSEQNAYYGEAFYQALKNGVANDELKDELKKVLRSFHREVDGGFDEILDRCDGHGCYSQGSLGYDGARTFLFGKYYLVKEGNQYGVMDVYCGKVRTGVGAGPDRIPNNTAVNIEHTWPQSRFNSKFNKGLQKADMHHLYPTDSKVNSIRGNFQLGEVEHETQKVPCGDGHFGRPVGGKGNVVFEPPRAHKGNAARALMYFSVRYDLEISPVEEDFLRKWSKEDPVDQEEQERNDEIYKLQGNRNPFIDIPGLEDRIRNF